MRVYSTGREGASGPVAGTPLVLISDWWTESDINDSGFSEAAGDALFASLIDFNESQNGKLFNSSFHFIAHSRGTAVTSELLQRLGEYEDRVLHKELNIHLTTLDVHDEFGGFDANGNVINTTGQTNLKPLGINWTDFNEPSVLVWNNVDFAENYYQTIGTTAFSPNGREVVGADLNVSLNGLAGFLKDDANFELSKHAFLGPHSRVWRWYAGTTDLTTPTFEPTVAGKESIFRSLMDVPKFNPLIGESIGGGGSLPWYVPQSIVSNYYGQPSLLNPAILDAPWEGIGVGWWYSEIGGGSSKRPTANLSARIPVGNDNTAFGETMITPDLTVWSGSSIPTLFNGDFEAGNMQRGLINPIGRHYRGSSTPGWAFHQADFNDPTPVEIVSYVLPGSSVEGHAAELRAGGDIELVHNRFYIPMEAQFVQFKYFVKEVETGINSQGQHVQRQPKVDVLIRIGDDEYRLGNPLSPSLPTSSNRPVQFQVSEPLSLSNAVDVNSPTGATRDLRGLVGELIFRLSFGPNEPPPDLSGATHTRIWINDVRLGPVGTPLQVQSAAPSDGTTVALNSDTLATLLGASRGQWLGIVHAPDGVAGFSRGPVEVPTDILASASNQGEGGHRHQ